ncbi:hypothetical protein F5Y18DRAFT_141699 [Xylariaceae sp. FL1019]|nr:hypothetical protein F5Y18DRAFT_141699 [Xylariaceae sp. FL1019]
MSAAPVQARYKEKCLERRAINAPVSGGRCTQSSPPFRFKSLPSGMNEPRVRLNSRWFSLSFTVFVFLVRVCVTSWFPKRCKLGIENVEAVEEVIHDGSVNRRIASSNGTPSSTNQMTPLKSSRDLWAATMVLFVYAFRFPSVSGPYQDVVCKGLYARSFGLPSLCVSDHYPRLWVRFGAGASPNGSRTAAQSGCPALP